MCKKDAAKARIKKLEGDLLGLVYRLKNLSTQPNLFSTASQAFNARSAQASLFQSFSNAALLEQEIKLQILNIREELSALSFYQPHDLELSMAA